MLWNKDKCFLKLQKSYSPVLNDLLLSAFLSNVTFSGGESHAVSVLGFIQCWENSNDWILAVSVFFSFFLRWSFVRLKGELARYRHGVSAGVVVLCDFFFSSFLSHVHALVSKCVWDIILETLCAPVSINVTPGPGLKKPLSVSAWLDSLSPHLSLCRKPLVWFPPTPLACVCVCVCRHLRVSARMPVCVCVCMHAPLCCNAHCPVGRIAFVFANVCFSLCVYTHYFTFRLEILQQQL